jgi:hypothetical protein
MKNELKNVLISGSIYKKPLTLINAPLNCKLCNASVVHMDYCDFNKTCNGYDFGRSGVLVEYFRCSQCGFLFTDFFDDWSNQDFSEFVYNDEYVKADPDYNGKRPRGIAAHLNGLLAPCRGTGSLLDYGGGSGIFVEEMRKNGYIDSEVYDPFAQPIKPNRKFDIITAFEVIEHTTDPLKTFEEIFNFMNPQGCLVISQTIQPQDIESLGAQWWYVAPRNGHVSFYTDFSMGVIASMNNMQYARNEWLMIFHRSECNVFVHKIKEILKPIYI